MATLEVALRNVRAEISDTIREITPNRRVKSTYGRFTEHDAIDKDQPIEEQTGHGRLFEIKAPVSTGQRQDGGSETIEHWEFPVVFCYPRSSTWYSVARDDMDKIARLMRSGHGSHGVTGINSRWVFDTPTEEPLRNPEDPWDYYTLTITVITQTTAT